ncbi:MAG TPA: PLDc N-terminal domain-containing protein [Micromonosporaceae bacterium]|nr:PLDc N-terminal domain-containing protein [Micromonosporaceae bacterium]
MQVADQAVPWAALVPVVVILLAFVAYCLVDIARSDVRYLPKWAWVVICLISIPAGGIVYLLIGRAHR